MEIGKKQLQEIDAASGNAIAPCPLNKKKGKQKKNPGNLTVQVTNICNGDPIEGASVEPDNLKGTTDANGIASFSGIEAKSYSVKVKKSFPKENYMLFVANSLNWTWKHDAESNDDGAAIVPENDTVGLEIKLYVFRTLTGIMFCRKQIEFNGDDKYGHWWTEVNHEQSYGWWPKDVVGSGWDAPHPVKPAPIALDASTPETIAFLVKYAAYKLHCQMYKGQRTAGQLIDTFGGVDGELNGVSTFGGSRNPPRDPHHGTKADDCYQPVINDCRDNAAIEKEIDDYAMAYSGSWAWRFELAGQNCHSFQIDLMEKCNLEKVKSVSSSIA